VDGHYNCTLLSQGAIGKPGGGLIEQQIACIMASARLSKGAGYQMFFYGVRRYPIVATAAPY
jgi:hypothetical protein